MNHILRLNGIYTFRTDRTAWGNQAPRYNNILSYQVSGCYEHTFDFAVLQVKQDHIFNIGENDSYSVRRVEKGYSICVLFESEKPVQTELIDCAGNPRFAVLFRKLLQYRNLNEPTNYYIALSLLYEIMALTNAHKEKAYVPKTTAGCFEEVKSYLHNNFCDSGLDIAQLPQKCGFSDKYFRERFRALYGSTPKQYLINLRLDEAAKRLAQGIFSVGDVAEAAGFSDIYYFSRLFKKKFQCPPSAYAKSQQPQNIK